MDTQKVTEFLQKIIDQLGPMGDKAFRIVAGRVIAESVISIVAGVIFVGICILVARKFWKWAVEESKKENKGLYSTDDSLIWYSFSVGTIITGGLLGTMLIAPAAINLMSIDYTTIERILNLVNGVK